jgi:tRNA-Thr(GGU) m(6)t(6)A37 methyltransferase TsaA
VADPGSAVRDVTLAVIGTVRNDRSSLADYEWGRVESAIEILPPYAAGLTGLGSFSHLIVLFYMHAPTGESPTLLRRPRGRADMPELGVFAQRGRNRPNPVGITTCEILRVEPTRVVVRGLDAVEGTPVLDLKPYYPIFDRRDARVPEWVDRLMEGYFERR